MPQSQAQVGKLLLQYPAVASIYSRFCNESLTPKKPTLDIRVQKADTDLMYRRAKNAWYDGRVYYEKDKLRGTRREKLYAIGGNEQLISHIPAIVFDHNTDITVKDIFKIIEQSSDAKYLVWATKYDWYTEPSIRDTNAGATFGNLVESDLYLVIYTKPKDLSWAQLVEKAAQIKFETKNAYKYPPKETPDLPAIHKLLWAGTKIHGFSSGGGLRVVSTSNKLNKKEFYGEAPSAEEALQYLEEDILAGGRKYSEVYGKLHPRYLTGSSMSTSNVDHWLRRGNSFDCFQEDSQVCIVLHGYAESKPSQELMELCQQNPGKKYYWEDRGFRYQIAYIWNLFDDHTPGHTWQVLNREDQPGKSPDMYHASRTGYGQNIWEAFQAAFVAPDVEEIVK